MSQRAPAGTKGPKVKGQGASGEHEAAPSAGVDYRLLRQRTLAALSSGRLSRVDVCDAHPELMRAARALGVVTKRACPVCAKARVVIVTYVFGPRLPSGGRCVRDAAERRILAQRNGALCCYEVEVCPECAWNHLQRRFTESPRGKSGLQGSKAQG